MSRAKRVSVTALRPLDGQPEGATMIFSESDAKALEKRGLVSIEGDAPDDEGDALGDEGKEAAPAENKDAAQGARRPANKGKP